MKKSIRLQLTPIVIKIVYPITNKLTSSDKF